MWTSLAVQPGSKIQETSIVPVPPMSMASGSGVVSP
jgi:hypothetical protein